ncbi:MAG: aspartate kinase, partial [Deltaproteobacteria bacterium CG11_big_fil_rev_8_21_14_0_20_49_13]
IKKVAEHAVATQKAGNKVIVVVSAMSGETDRLLKLGSSASSLTGDGGIERELDALVATGEMTTAALTAIAIKTLGVAALSLNGFQVPVVTDSEYQRSRMKYIDTARIERELKDGKIVVVAGFQGVDKEGNITTIGRGGSDTSAVAMASALKADWCEIYSDVDGLFSADPNLCKGARKIDNASYEELLETAGAGAKVVHMHAVELAARQGINLHLKRSPSIDGRAEDQGTKVTREEINMADVLVSTVAHTSNEAKISVRAVPNMTGLTARLFEPLAKFNINVDMIVENVSSNGTSDVSFTIAKQDLKKTMQLTENVAKEIGAGKVEMMGDVAKISIIGVGMRSHAGVAAKMFRTLAKEGIDIQMISTSEIKVSVVVDSKYVEKAVNALHSIFISSPL